MGVLDRLESEAREARERREQACAARSRQVAATSGRLAPALERAGEYMERLAGHLAELGRVVQADYVVDDLGELRALAQAEYLASTSGAAVDEVRLSFTCTGVAPLVATIQGHAQAEALARRARECGLDCRLHPVSERAMEVRVAPRVTARVTFAPDLDRELVRLELTNLPELGARRYLLAPERVDEALLDAVANLILREPSALGSLTGSVVDDERRAHLHRQLARERRLRDAEIAGGSRRFFFPIVEWFRQRFLGR